MFAYNLILLLCCIEKKTSALNLLRHHHYIYNKAIIQHILSSIKNIILRDIQKPFHMEIKLI